MAAKGLILHKQDYYITANTMRGVDRVSEGLFSLNNIVIDIDCHEGYTSAEVMQEFEYRLYRDVIDLGELPEPNSFVWSGRGLQLWWAIEPISYKCQNYYRTIVNRFIVRIQELLDEYPELFEEINVDIGASSNVVGWFRFPGSYNTVAKTFGRLEIKHSVLYNTHDLIKVIPVSEPARKEPKTAQRAARTDIYNYQNLYTLALERYNQMKILQELRYNQHSKVGRDFMILVIYCSFVCAGSTDQEAMDKIKAFNQGFRKPLSDRTLRQYTSSARRNGGYPLSNTWILEHLEITDEEQARMGLYERETPWRPIKERTSNFARDLERKERKEQRNKTILRLAGYGWKYSKIAKHVGCSERTVRTVAGGTDVKAIRNKEIQRYKDLGYTQKEVAAILQIGLRTVKTHWTAENKTADNVVQKGAKSGKNGAYCIMGEGDTLASASCTSAPMGV